MLIDKKPGVGLYEFTINNLYEKLSADGKGAMIALYLWCLYCLISPVYIFHSGLPQPADYVMMIACFTLVMHASANKNIKINSYYRSILFLAFGFALYVVLLTLFGHSNFLTRHYYDFLFITATMLLF